MALATRCPQCGALFRVGADQLKSRGGLVRCGSCQHVFNAIGRLDYLEPNVDTIDPAARRSATPTQAPVAPPSLARPKSEAATEAPVTEAPPDVAAANRPRARAAAAKAPRRAEPATRDLGEVTRYSPQTALPPDLADSAVAQDADDSDSDAQAAPVATGEDASNSETPELEPTFLRAGRKPMGRAGRAALAAGCIVLAPALLLEILLVFRADILAQFPQLQPTISAVCAPLGCSAQWPMHPEMLAVVSSELQAVAGTDALELDAVVRNRAGFPVALPAIELTITDRSDRPIARKVFLPQDYIVDRSGSGEAADAPLGAGADLSIRLLFELRGTTAAGFVAYPFYP
jgi:predicted Zn finger-like uncharacterized protein